MKCVCVAVVLVFLLSLSDQNKFRKRVIPQGTDCTHIKTLHSNASSGIYVLQPLGARVPFKAYCEMLPDGGWTVFQRRSGGKVTFNRNWKAYKQGFGHRRNDHWLGLKRILQLTKNYRKSWTLRVDLWDHDGGRAYAEYRDFRLGNEREAFKLSVGAYSGDAGDAITGLYKGIDQRGFGFSTLDRDHDGCSPCLFGDILESECSQVEGGGGWWYSRCGSASLHGEWHPAGQHLGWASGLHWRTWKGPAPYSARATRMMVKAE